MSHNHYRLLCVSKLVLIKTANNFWGVWLLELRQRKKMLRWFHSVVNELLEGWNEVHCQPSPALSVCLWQFIEPDWLCQHLHIFGSRLSFPTGPRKERLSSLTSLNLILLWDKPWSGTSCCLGCHLNKLPASQELRTGPSEVAGFEVNSEVFPAPSQTSASLDITSAPSACVLEYEVMSPFTCSK